MSLSPPPSREKLPITTEGGRQVAEMPRAWIKWFSEIKELLAPAANGGQILWDAISKAGSNLTDLTIRNHADLQNVNSSTYTHLTELTATDLTDGGNTILHKHTHNLQDGLQGGTTDEYYHNTFHEDALTDIVDTQWSTGIVGTGNLVTDGGAGTINIASSSVLLRQTNSDTADIFEYVVPAATALTLTDLSNNYVYVEYNAGVPQYVATITERTDTNTNVLVARVYRSGTVLHINNYAIVRANDNLRRVSLRFVQTEPIGYASGAMLSEIGTRNIYITAGVFWMCTNRITTNLFDSSAGGTFTYAYRNGTGGWTEQVTQTQINNTQYDNGSGTLQTLTTNRYGVAWVYQEVDNDVVVVYGQGDYTLSQANAATAPASVPPRITAQGYLVGKIILQKSATTFTSVESAFLKSLTTSIVNDHEQLAGLLGGAANDHYHFTGSQRIATINKMGTCLVTGCVLSINADTTKFDISSGTLRFVNNYTNPLSPTYTEITYAGSTGNVVTNLATQDSTYVSIDVSSVLYQSAIKLSNGDTRVKVLLGALIHTNRTSITSADSTTEVIGFDIPNALADVSLAIGPVNTGNELSGNAINTLRLNKTAGTFTQTGINWKNSKQNPNIITTPASTGAAFLATWRNGTGGWTTAVKTDIIPGVYDDGTGGATQPNGVVLNNKWSLIKWWYLPNSQIIGIAFGQAIYNSLADAEAHKSDPTIDNPALASIPFRGWIAVRGGATNLTLAADAQFIDAGRFGTTTSGGGSGSLVPTMQNSYDNSVQPQITTSTALGAVQIKRGSAADTDVVFEVLNGAGTPVFQITGQGAGSAISLAAARAVSTLRI